MPRVDDWFIVSGVVVNPYDNNKIYANSYLRGIFYSGNGGGFWTAMNDSLNINYSRATTIINPHDTCMVYLATDQQSVWTFTRTQTIIDQPAETLPTEYSLSQNRPNPFNNSTVIEFALPQAGEVSLAIYDILGREVMRPVNSHKEAGRHTITVDMGDAGSGVYIYILRANDLRIERKMLLLR